MSSPAESAKAEAAARDKKAGKKAVAASKKAGHTCQVLGPPRTRHAYKGCRACNMQMADMTSTIMTTNQTGDWSGCSKIVFSAQFLNKLDLMT